MRTPSLLMVALTVGCLSSKTNQSPLLVASSAVPTAGLKAKLASTPFRYFRFVNSEFSREVCRRFEPVLRTMPLVNLHGDAHLEQFAVTGHSAGLHDFDDSVGGPPIMDLVRFAVSIRLALEQRGWQADSARMVERFLTSYRMGLDSPIPTNEIRVVGKLRARFAETNDEFLASAVGLMKELPEPVNKRALAGYQRYVTLMLSLQSEHPREFFALKQYGALRSGIGSARTARLLARIEGPTTSPSDDIILEAKEVRDLSSVPCIQTYRGDALRVVAGSSSFGRQADPFLAVIPRAPSESLDDPPWWVQSWNAQYGELDIDTTLASVDELAEVVEAVGAQLAAGHISRMKAPYDRQLAALVRDAIDQNAVLIRTVIAELTTETKKAHASFKARQ